MKAARARLEIYDQEIKQEHVHQPIRLNNRQFTLNTPVDLQRPHTDKPAPPTDVSYLAQANEESIIIIIINFICIAPFIQTHAVQSA